MSSLKRCVLEAAFRSGLFRIGRVLTAATPRILVYHAFSRYPTASSYHLPLHVFRAQVQHIAKHYRVVRLLDIAEALATRKRLPPRSVAITVDDGYESFYRYAYPVLREFGLPATVFVITELSDRNGWTWPDRLATMAASPRPPEPLRTANYSSTRLRLLRMPPVQREREMHRIAVEAGLRLPEQAPDEFRLANWTMLREMQAGGLIDIGAHTRTHPALATLTDEQAWDEVKGSKDDIARHLGAPPAVFCYPFGNEGDYTWRQETLVLEAGYRCAVCSTYGFVDARSRLGALRRVGALNAPLCDFSKYLDGPEYLQRRILR